MDLDVSTFRGECVFFEDSDKFSKGNKVENVLGLFIEVLEQLNKVLLYPFALGLNDQFEITVKFGVGCVQLVDSEEQLIVCLNFVSHVLLLLHVVVLFIM